MVKAMPGNVAEARGDLIVLIEEEAHAQLQRDGLNVALTCISLSLMLFWYTGRSAYH